MHTVVSHIPSNTHMHAAVSMRPLLVQRLDQFESKSPQHSQNLWVQSVENS